MTFQPPPLTTTDVLEGVDRTAIELETSQRQRAGLTTATKTAVGATRLPLLRPPTTEWDRIQRKVQGQAQPPMDLAAMADPVGIVDALVADDFHRATEDQWDPVAMVDAVVPPSLRGRAPTAHWWGGSGQPPAAPRSPRPPQHMLRRVNTVALATQAALDRQQRDEDEDEAALDPEVAAMVEAEMARQRRYGRARRPAAEDDDDGDPYAARIQELEAMLELMGDEHDEEAGLLWDAQPDATKAMLQKFDPKYRDRKYFQQRSMDGVQFGFDRTKKAAEVMAAKTDAQLLDVTRRGLMEWETKMATERDCWVANKGECDTKGTKQGSNCEWNDKVRFCLPKLQQDTEEKAEKEYQTYFNKKEDPAEQLAQQNVILQQHIVWYLTELRMNPLVNGAELLSIAHLVECAAELEGGEVPWLAIMKENPYFRRRMTSWCSARRPDKEHCLAPCDLIRPGFWGSIVSNDQCGFDKNSVADKYSPKTYLGAIISTIGEYAGFGNFKNLTDITTLFYMFCDHALNIFQWGAYIVLSTMLLAPITAAIVVIEALLASPFHTWYTQLSNTFQEAGWQNATIGQRIMMFFLGMIAFLFQVLGFVRRTTGSVTKWIIKAPFVVTKGILGFLGAAFLKIGRGVLSVLGPIGHILAIPFMWMTGKATNGDSVFATALAWTSTLLAGLFAFGMWPFYLCIFVVMGLISHIIYRCSTTDDQGDDALNADNMKIIAQYMEGTAICAAVANGETPGMSNPTNFSKPDEIAKAYIDRLIKATALIDTQIQGNKGAFTPLTQQDIKMDELTAKLKGVCDLVKTFGFDGEGDGDFYLSSDSSGQVQTTVLGGTASELKKQTCRVMAERWQLKLNSKKEIQNMTAGELAAQTKQKRKGWLWGTYDS
jgi:hypothetical protein